jgi:hypothetical protein
MTRIDVVDGADGLTPDMLRHKSPPKPKRYWKWQDIPRKGALRQPAFPVEPS